MCIDIALFVVFLCLVCSLVSKHSCIGYDVAFASDYATSSSNRWCLATLKYHIFYLQASSERVTNSSKDRRHFTTAKS